MSSEDIWRMIRRQEKAVEDLRRLVKMGVENPKSLEDAEKRLGYLYGLSKEVEG